MIIGVPSIDDLLLSEEDIKLRYITPAITCKGWSLTDISMEARVKLTDGKINLRGNLVARGKAKFADYMLYYNRATPIAIVEAKDANHSVSHGMQQAKELLDLGLNFDQCKFPKEEEEVLRPEELLKQYHEKRTALDAKIDKQLEEIENLLGIKID